MKKESALALALLLFVVLSCEPNNKPANTDSGPVSESGPERTDYGPPRNPYENEDDYRKRQQGGVGPCAQNWDTYHRAYFDFKAGRITRDQYLNAEQTYEACCKQYYP